MQIFEATHVDDELISALQRLVPQLDPAATPPSREQLKRIIAAPGCALLVGREGSSPAGIHGMITLAWYPIPTGVRAWIEDLVVDSAVRSGGLGAALVRAAVERARREGAAKVDLTSRPARKAANLLYERLGFDRRNTNVYRYRINDIDP